jgi:two-component system sensor histidine kinase YesM
MIIMLFILLVAILMLGILIAIRKDITHLTEDIRNLSIDGAEGAVQPSRIAELQPVSTVINQTMEELRQSIRREQKLTADSYEARLAQTRSEMLAYRSQINPHFLFNTMESIRSMAHHYHAPLIEQVVGGMSQMFRYALYSPMIVPLEEELGHLGSYFSVMCARFPGRYRILEKIDPDTLSVPILSMILQPLAENALLHAFNGRKSGILLIQSFTRDGRLIVRIADNGIGIPEELLETIIDKMKTSTGETAHVNGHSDHGKDYKSSIGLPNIYRRLKLTFGDQAEMLLRSKEYYYTVVELQIPIEKAGE